MIYLYIGAGGIIGSLCRYLLSNLAGFLWGMEFPIDTLLINLSGALFLGWFSGKFVFPKKLNPNLIGAISTGLVGSYTTFSTFSVETVRFLMSGDLLPGMLYLGISLIGGLLLVRMGLTIGEQQRIKKAGHFK